MSLSDKKSGWMVIIPVVLLTLCWSLSAYQLTFTANQFSFVPNGPFEQVQATGFCSCDSPPGAPELPVEYASYILPQG